MKKTTIDFINTGLIIFVVFVIWLLLGISLSGYKEIPIIYNVIFFLIAGFVVSNFFPGSKNK